jgi:hypothetical protein
LVAEFKSPPNRDFIGFLCWVVFGREEISMTCTKEHFQTHWTKLKQIYLVNKDKCFKVIVLTIFLFVTLAHVFRLEDVPAGLYVDETSIGYNAALVAQTGIDEHGVYLPVYFEAFGEYKNPIYIYTTALIFKFFGVSEFNLRFTSFLFYFLALVFSLSLISNIFRNNRIIQIYFLLSFGFLPQFFTLSRVSFEVISQLTFISAALLLIWKLFNEQKTNILSYLKAVLCGLIIGLSVYTYSTARILSILMLISLWVVYLKRENLKKLASVTLMFLISLIPYILFIINNPGAITSRFSEISYIYSDISVTRKIATFISNLVVYWSPDFLIKFGDANLRHAIGYGGIVFTATYILFLLGFISILTQKKLILNRFNLFLLGNLFFSPLAAALTLPGTPHSLRSLLLGLFLLIFSCFGLKFITEINPIHSRRILIACILTYLVCDIAAYQANYFIYYPAKSVSAMKSYGFKESLQDAINNNPKEVILLDRPFEYYASLKFFTYLVKNPQNIPITMSDEVEPVPGICVLFQRDNGDMLKHSSYLFNESENPYQLNRIERLFLVKTPPAMIKLKCYKSSQ